MDGYCDVKRVSVGAAVRVPPHVAHTDLDIYYNNNLVRLKGASGEGVCRRVNIGIRASRRGTEKREQDMHLWRTPAKSAILARI